MRLTNKAVIITGAGSGIGRATAYLFAREGAKIVVADCDKQKGEETATTIINNGGTAIYVYADVSIASEVELLINKTIDKFGKIDVLFNNAGIDQGSPINVENIDELLWDKIFGINVKGIFLAAKYSVPHMKVAGGGIIINTASIAAIRPRIKSCAYASSKGAVITLTKCLALELASSHIRVNCINPVATDTPLVRNSLDEKGIQAMISTIPLGYLAKPEDIAFAALFLASDESSMITGACIDVDGGRGI